MLINKITIKNFRSFGNDEQTIELPIDKGQLILISGGNGEGKSSILQNFDYTLFGKVKGRKKALAMSSLPNRINKELLSTIQFNSNGTQIEVKRGINPNMLELYENNILYDRAGKVNVDDRLQKWIGIDLDTFKSFISLNVSDFKNFISLSTEEKRLLLDKLFNLEAINILNGVLKTIASENKKEMDILEREVLSYQSSMESIRKNLDKAKQSEFETVEQDIIKIKEQITSNKSEWELLKEKKTKIDLKEKELSTKSDDDKREYITIQNEVKNCNISIDLYNSGKCPTCKSDLSGDEHAAIKHSFVDKKDSLLKVSLELQNTIKEWNDKKLKLRKIADDTNSLYGELSSTLRSLKLNLDNLQAKTKNEMVSESIQKFEETITEINTKKVKSEDHLDVNREKSLYHKELSKVFSENGVKKVIIKNIIDPINFFITQNIKKINLPFEVILDETFDAKIFSLGNEIDPETLSTGESKKINLCILIAYLKLIRLKRSINILFLDEVFSSIDIESIDGMLEMIKDFASEYKINIFLVHHAILAAEHFDRILIVEKNIFSKISEKVTHINE